MATNEIEILVKAEVTKAIAGLKQVGDAAKGSANEMLSAANIIKGALTGAVALAFKNAVLEGQKFLDLNEDLAAQFGKSGQAAIELRNTLVQSFGYSLNEASKLLGETGRLTQSLGFTNEQSLVLSGNIAKLADKLALSSTSGISAAEAAEALTRSLSGQTKGLISLGIPLNDNEIKQEALARGISATRLETDRAAKAQIIFDLALRKSGETLDAASISSLSLAEKRERLEAFGKSVFTIFGAELAQRIAGTSDGLLKFATSAGALQTVANVTHKVIDAFKLFASLVFAVPITLTTGLIDVGTAIFELGKNFLSLGNVISLALSGKGKDAFEALKDVGVKAFKDIKDNATVTASFIQSTLNTGKDLFFKNEDDQVLKAKESGEKKKDIQKSVTTETEEQLKKRIDAERAAAKTITDFALSSAQSALNILDQFLQRSVNTANLANDQLLELDASRRNELKVRDSEDYAKSLADLQAQLSSETDEKKKAEIQQKIDRLNSDFEYNGKKDALDEAANEKDKEIKKEQWKRTKAIQISAAIIQGIQATLAAYSAGAAIPVVGPPVIGPIFAALAGAFAGVQTALIASEPMPSFAEGGLVTGPFPAMVGHGTEAILPAELTDLLLSAAGAGGSSSTTNNDTKNITLVAQGIQDPTAFINKAQRVLGNNVFGGSR